MGTGPTAAGAAVHKTNTQGRKYRTAAVQHSILRIGVGDDE